MAITIFVRHKFREDYVNEALWKDKRIGIGFDRIRSANPDEYKVPGGKSGMRRLKECTQPQTIIAATYSNHDDTIIIGSVSPQSETKFWETKDIDGDLMIVKWLPLEHWKEVNYLDYPVLLAAQPRGGTIFRWKTLSSELLSHILDGTRLRRKVRLLHPSQLEVLCYEYMLMEGVLTHLVMPIGRTLRDVDIWGVGDEGGTVLAQVTFGDDSRTLEKKMRNLVELGRKDSKAKLLFFGPRSGNAVAISAVKYIPIEDVFTSLDEDSIHGGHSLISKMLGRE